MSEAERNAGAPPPGGLLHHARRDSIRILLTIAFRNLLASPVRTTILGGIILLGSLLVLVSTSLLDSIDRGVRTSIQGSLGGHLQIYDGRSEDQLAIYGDMTGYSRLEPIEDFAKLKGVVAKVENVKQVVPMGIDQAMVATGNTFDLAVERLRDDARRLEAGQRGADLVAAYGQHKAHVRRMCELLSEQLIEARVVAELTGKEADERRKERLDLDRATGAAFWEAFDRDRFGGLEFLENRIAPLVLDGGFTFLTYVGTDTEAFFEAFSLAQVAKGEKIPPGQRGILVGEQWAEQWLKLRNARRLDEIKDMRDRRGMSIAKDEELQRKVRENGSGLREIMLQLDPVEVPRVEAELRQGLGATEGEDLEKLLQKLFAATDRDFDEKYALFYRVIAPRIRLYIVNIGDVVTIKAPSKSGYFSSVNVKVYGFLSFRGVEKSSIAGMMSVMDIHSFRDLYGYLTPERRAEIEGMKARLGAREIGRDEAEAALFGGGGGAELVGVARAGAIDDDALVVDRSQDTETGAVHRVYTREEAETGVALNAAVILHDPKRIPETMEAIRQALDDAGMGYREVKDDKGEVVEKSGAKIIDWQTASGFVGQFVTLIRFGLVAGMVILLAIALVIINNSMVLATLQRVKEIGTMRAIGTQRRFVVVMLLVEIMSIGLVFGLAGAFLGSGVIGLVRLAGGIPATNDMLYFLFAGPALLPHLGASAMISSLVIVLLVSILSALYPALLAMRVTPVEAMAMEE